MQTETEFLTPEPLPQGKKRILSAWPLEAFQSVNPLIAAQLADSLALSSQSSWFLDQLLHHFGQWELVCRDGYVDPRLTAKHNLGSEFQRGCWILACRLPRSKLVPNQTLQPEFSTFVPLILAGIKRYQGVPYSKWSKEGLEAVMPPELVEAATTEWPEINQEELLELRREGLLIRSGKQQGQLRDPKASWKLYSLGSTEFGKLPKLTQVQMTQIWLCHPELRHSDMITQPYDWDRRPEPLITAEPLAKWTALQKLPWE
jgi:hypothetical protein